MCKGTEARTHQHMAGEKALSAVHRLPALCLPPQLCPSHNPIFPVSDPCHRLHLLPHTHILWALPPTCKNPITSHPSRLLVIGSEPPSSLSLPNWSLLPSLTSEVSLQPQYWVRTCTSSARSPVMASHLIRVKTKCFKMTQKALDNWPTLPAYQSSELASRHAPSHSPTPPPWPHAVPRTRMHPRTSAPAVLSAWSAVLPVAAWLPPLPPSGLCPNVAFTVRSSLILL